MSLLRQDSRKGNDFILETGHRCLFAPLLREPLWWMTNNVSLQTEPVTRKREKMKSRKKRLYIVAVIHKMLIKITNCDFFFFRDLV